MCRIEILIQVLDMWHGCYLDFMYCMIISSFPVAVFTSMWQKQFPIKNKKENHTEYQILVLKYGRIRFCRTLILFWHEMSFWHAHPRSRWHSSFWRFYLSNSAFQFFVGRNVRFWYPLSQQSLLYKILHYCKTITLWWLCHEEFFIITMCIKVLGLNTLLHSFSAPNHSWTEQSFMCVRQTVHSLQLLWWLVALISFALCEDCVGVCNICIQHFRDSASIIRLLMLMSDITGHFLYTLLRALCPCLRLTMEGTICGAVHLRSFSAVFYFFVLCACAVVC